jgi:nicotinamidase-related amidase
MPIPARKPRRPKGALLLVDFMNPLDFEGADKLVPKAIAAAKKTLALKRRCQEARIPVVYANDNFGRWESQFAEVVRACLDSDGPSAELARIIAPEQGDLSILKPRHSAFYGTPLEFLLTELHADSLILAGLTAESCVLFTACDAFLRGYPVWVPADCVASKTNDATRRALVQIECAAKVWTGPSRTPVDTGLQRAVAMHA